MCEQYEPQDRLVCLALQHSSCKESFCESVSLTQEDVAFLSDELRRYVSCHDRFVWFLLSAHNMHVVLNTSTFNAAEFFQSDSLNRVYLTAVKARKVKGQL